MEGGKQPRNGGLSVRSSAGIKEERVGSSVHAPAGPGRVVWFSV